MSTTGAIRDALLRCVRCPNADSLLVGIADFRFADSLGFGYYTPQGFFFYCVRSLSFSSHEVAERGVGYSITPTSSPSLS